MKKHKHNHSQTNQLTMTINFYEANGNRPARLFMYPDKVTIHDRIVFTEAYFSVDDKCVSFYGVLDTQSVGIENSKDKTWKLDNQKVLLSFYKNKKPTWNNDAKKMEDKEVEASENYLYTFAKDVLKNIAGDCVSAIIAPHVNPQFLEDMKIPQPDDVVAYWQSKVKNTIVVVELESLHLLAAPDKQFLTSTGNTGGKTYQKAETEAEKLEARWQFLKQHLGNDYGEITSLYQLGLLLGVSQTEPAGIESQRQLSETIELIKGMWK